MTTPSIPDLIAALEKHDGAMTSGEWTQGGAAVFKTVPFEGNTNLWTRIAEVPRPSNAAAIAWFGTHRGALAEALRAVARERDEAVKARDHHENARREASDSARDWMLEGESQRVRANKAEDDRDRLAAEVERLKSLLLGLGSNAHAEALGIETYKQERDRLVNERDAAIAARDSAVAKRDELRAIVDPVRGRELIAGLQQARDSAVNDTAEAIARWLLAEAKRMDAFPSTTNGAGPYALEEAAGDIRAGAWRGQNGGE